ncbi:MAG: DUF302 domain-containing protein [Chlorobi bacterium]|nr:DUF302 domain-containing protein [Chlorobiota bacterium]
MKTINILFLLTALLAGQVITAQQAQPYYFGKTVEGSFEDVTAKVKQELKNQGFGVITEIDMDAKLKEKSDDVTLPPYKILGVCNPGFAWKTIQAEENIGLFLPCKVLVKDVGDGKTEVVMVDPSVLMRMLGNEKLYDVAAKVTEKFKAALDKI